MPHRQERGEVSGDLVLEPVVPKRAPPADELHPRLLTPVIQPQDFQEADFPGPGDVCSAARVQVKGGGPVPARNLHQPDRPLHLWGPPEAEGRDLLRGDEEGPDWSVFPDDSVYQVLHRPQGLRCQPRNVQVNGAGLRTQMKGDGIAPQQLLTGSGEEVLARVLLHVVKPPVPVHLAGHVLCLQWGFQNVDDGPIPLPDFHAEDGDSVQGPPVRWLAAGSGVEGGPVQHDRRAALPLQPLHDTGGKRRQVSVGVIEPLYHRNSSRRIPLSRESW